MSYSNISKTNNHDFANQKFQKSKCKKYDDMMNEFFTAFKVACYKALNDNLSEEKDSCSLTLEPIEESKA